MIGGGGEEGWGEGVKEIEGDRESDDLFVFLLRFFVFEGLFCWRG